MILVITDNSEITSTEVIKWLIYRGQNFIRIHEDEFFDIKTHKKRIYLQSERSKFYLDQISSVWYRRGGLKFKRTKYSHASINRHMIEAQYWLEDYVLKTLESKKYINKQTNSSVNKLWVLQKAQEKGLDVPNYFLSEDIGDIELGNTITKTITEGSWIQNIEEKTDGLMYTSLVDQKPNKEFSISFLQEKVEKDFEIRSFYLNGNIWSIAIFSQNDEQTKLDFRKYNDEKPNRNVRYNLPKSIEAKICKLMKDLDLNSGSLDFIKSGDKFYFLEVNPIGQFLAVSTLCNYYLEKEVADNL